MKYRLGCETTQWKSGSESQVDEMRIKERERERGSRVEWEFVSEWNH
jgi:hypothetical protein